MPNVILYTRRDCHLCHEALDVLQRHGLVPQQIDIDADPDLLARYDTCVPVVVIDGRERFRGRVDERLLVRWLRRTSWAEAPRPQRGDKQHAE